MLLYECQSICKNINLNILLKDQVPDLKLLKDKKWRLQNLYKITNKNGDQVDFKLNWAQDELFDRMWYQMLVLKARQLGVTTFFAISFLDDCFWYPNTNAAIIADKRESAEIIFKRKIKYAYEKMPLWTREFNKARNDRVGELTFENGSAFIVSTGVRSGTYQRLLVSEFGKICISHPDYAQEIVSGSLNTVSRDQIVAIESTAAGRGGYFYNFAKKSEKLAKQKKTLTALEQRFFFFPWYLEPSYREENTVELPSEIKEYFKKVEGDTGVVLEEEQKTWYHLKNELLGESMKSEYPSTPQEAFETANEGFYYSKKISKLRKDGRICRVPYSDYSLVHTAWDIGLDDHTAIWFFQLNLGGEIQVIDFYENRDEDAVHYCKIVKSKEYDYANHFLPHDAGNRSIINKICYADMVEPLLPGSVHVLERKDPFTGIQTVRSILSKCVFDAEKCKDGIAQLEAYRREWDKKLGGYKSHPVHDSSSHAADAFRALAMALPLCKDSGSMEDQSEALRNYWGH